MSSSIRSYDAQAKLYQLDRLIAILLPDLHAHLKEEAINSSYYSSPYFITLFTSVLQMQTSGDHCQLLLRLWDYFIIVSSYANAV